MSTHATPGKVRLKVSLVAGSVHINAQDTSETNIEVVPRNDAAHDLMEEIREEARESGGTYEVVLEVPERGKKWGLFGSEPKFDVRAVVPTGADLRVDTVSADIVATGTFGSTHLHTTSGEARLEGSAETADLKTVSGDIRSGAVARDAHVQTVSGDASVQEVNGPLTLKSVSGDLTVRVTASDVRATSVSGDIEVGAAKAGNLTIKTTSGDIGIGIAPGINLWMDVSSLSGDTISELDASDATPAADRMEIRASSLSGDVTLRRAAAASV